MTFNTEGILSAKNRKKIHPSQQKFSDASALQCTLAEDEFNTVSHGDCVSDRDLETECGHQLSVKMER